VFVLTAKMKAAKGKEKDLETLLRMVVSQVRTNEKDTVVYNLHRRVDDPSVYFFYEQYKDRQAWEVAHLLTSYSKSFLAALPELLDGEVQVTHYELIDET
jgi:quinol monooxygenase YgiN